MILLFLSIVAVTQVRHGYACELLSLLVFYFALSRRLLPLISQIFFIVGQMEGSYDNVVRVDSELRDGLLNKNPIRPLLLPGEGFVLELNRMNYSFRQDVPILQELSLHLRKGETMVLRGVSGSGKSSLLNVLAGVSQSTSGAVRVDRGRIAYVLQEIPLLDDTIRNNLLFGLTNRSDEELMNALVAAKLEGLVAAPPLGLETALGDNRILFSGGERQRLGVGRAIVRCATLLLLDEATSALDEENERQLLDNLRASGIATIVVTHRTHAQPVAQRQVLLEQGCLIEDASGRSLRDKEESVLELHSDPNVEGLLAVST